MVSGGLRVVYFPHGGYKTKKKKKETAKAMKKATPHFSLTSFIECDVFSVWDGSLSCVKKFRVVFLPSFLADGFGQAFEFFFFLSLLSDTPFPFLGHRTLLFTYVMVFRIV